jgi:hypothetical protein
MIEVSPSALTVAGVAVFAFAHRSIFRMIGAISIAYHEVWRDRRVAVCRACGGLESASEDWCTDCGGLVEEVEHAPEFFDDWDEE